MKYIIFFRRKLLIPIIITLVTYYGDNSFNTLKDAVNIFALSFSIVWVADSLAGKAGD